MAKAVYIKIGSDKKIARTIEFAPETFIDVSRGGKLIGIEILNPARSFLKQIAKKFHQPELSKVNTSKLQQSVAA